jgi:hypothetical protein
MYPSAQPGAQRATNCRRSLCASKEYREGGRLNKEEAALGQVKCHLYAVRSPISPSFVVVGAQLLFLLRRGYILFRMRDEGFSADRGRVPECLLRKACLERRVEEGPRCGDGGFASALYSLQMAHRSAALRPPGDSFAF